MEETRKLPLPVRAGDPDAGYRAPPQSVQIEQALLGAMLVNNEAFHRVGDFLKAEHFYDPIHRRLFEAVAQRILKGQLADPNTLAPIADGDEGFQELGGARYLRTLAAMAEPLSSVRDYSQLVHDLSLRRGLIEIGEEIVGKAYDPSADESGREQIESAERRLFALVQEGEVKGDFRAFPAVLTDAVSLIERAYHKAGQVTGVPTGLAAMDEKLGGLQRSDLLILAGRPSMGKTALAMTIAANAADVEAPEVERDGSRHKNYVVGVFSLEMSGEQLATRLLSAEALIPSDELRRGRVQEDEWHRIVRGSQTLARRALFIDDTPALSVAALRTRARRLKRTQGLHLLVVDYLQLMRGSSTNMTNRVLEIGEITQGLKAIAKELDIPVLALSQLSRAVEQRDDKRPLLSDLRDSGTIEQDADIVMFVFREEYYLTRSPPMQKENEKDGDFQDRLTKWKERCEAVYNKADVIVAKQRNGSIGPIQLQFDARYGQFYNLEQRAVPESWQ